MNDPTPPSDGLAFESRYSSTGYDGLRPPLRDVKWDGRMFPGRCTWCDPVTGEQCGNQAVSSVGWWDGGGPGLGEWQQSGSCVEHSSAER